VTEGFQTAKIRADSSPSPKNHANKPLMSFLCALQTSTLPKTAAPNLLFWSPPQQNVNDWPQLFASIVLSFRHSSQVEAFKSYFFICYSQELLRVRLLITIICAELKEKYPSDFKELW